MSEYKVKFEVFEGPLDLLLYLIKKEEVDIYEVNLTQLATQFIEYILKEITQSRSLRFSALFANATSRTEVVVTFLAMLEMIRLKLIRIFQAGSVGAIRVYKRARPADAPHPLGDPADPVQQN